MRIVGAELNIKVNIMDMQSAIKAVTEKQDLSREEMAQVMN